MYLLDETHLDIRRAAREFALGEFNDIGSEYDKKEEFPFEVWKKACNLGFIGMFIQEKYGGAGVGMLETVLTIEEFSRVDPAFTSILYTTLGSEIIQTYGDPFQKAVYLPSLAKGEAIMGAPCNGRYFNLATKSILTASNVGEEYLVNGEELFVMNGSIANYLIITCLTSPRSNLVQEKFSTIIIPTTSPKIKSLEIKGKFGLRTLNFARVFFENARIPGENIINGNGEGYRHLEHLTNTFNIYFAAQGLGIAQGALDMAVNYAKIRKQFGLPIGHFQSTRLKIAEMATLVESARILLYQTALDFDKGTENRSMVLMTRWFTGEVCEKNTEGSIQLHGGYGFTKDYKIERLYRDGHALGILNGSKEKIKLGIADSLLGRKEA